MRYRFYRVHKYVCFELAEFERAAAKTDFTNLEACELLKDKWINLTNLLKHHGEYENAHIHHLLQQKGSNLAYIIEKEHQEHELAFNQLLHKIEIIITTPSQPTKILLGNEFYLSYRIFYSDMLKHLYDEETILLPELQALYSDDELAQLQAKTYQKMSPEDMLGMLNLLFPHFNPEDMQFFITEIKTAEPEKFAILWKQLSTDYKLLINA